MSLNVQHCFLSREKLMVWALQKKYAQAKSYKHGPFRMGKSNLTKPAKTKGLFALQTGIPAWRRQLSQESEELDEAAWLCCLGQVPNQTAPKCK